jgi:hypothetical protein
VKGGSCALRPGMESTDIGHEMRNDARLTCTLRSLCWAARLEHHPTDAADEHNAQCRHKESLPQREYRLTGHHPILTLPK